MIRSLLLAIAILGATSAAALAQSRTDAPAMPVLRADVSVTADVVTIGDVIDNAGDAASIAIYRAPDLGTTGSLPAAQVVAALRAHQVIGVVTNDIRDVSVTRLARTLEPKDVELQVAHALEHRDGLGDAADLLLTFDRSLQTIQLDAANNGPLRPVSARFDARSGRFDIVFEIANGSHGASAKLRFTGTAVETVEAAVLTRDVDRNDVLKASDVVVERRPIAEVGRNAADRNQTVGMQARRQLRSGQALRTADLAKPDLVRRDQPVTITYQAAGIYLTIRGKSLENGTEGDVVNVTNLQTKRTISGVVVGRGQVSVTAATTSPRVSSIAAPVAVAANDNASVSRRAE